jgi:hypothetical protein
MNLYKKGMILIPLMDEQVEKDIKNSGWPYKIIIIKKTTDYVYRCKIFYRNTVFNKADVTVDLLNNHFKKSFKEVLKKL